MGHNKTLVPFLGQPLIARVIERLRPAAAELLVTTNTPHELGFLDGLRLVPDARPGFGALGGLYTALSAASSRAVAVVACDMPFASLALVRAEAELLERGGYDVVVPALEGLMEPLHAVYRRETCLKAVSEALDAGRKRMVSWYEDVNVHVVADDALACLGVDHLTFININTDDDLRSAEALARDNPGL